MYVEESERIALRVEKIEGWLDYLDHLYGDLISRPEETASVAGFDGEPRQRPCEHRSKWMRGHLCLACDNTGWRALWPWEDPSKEGIDPYAADVRAGVVLVQDTAATKRAREGERLDAILASLERNKRIRAGSDAPESRESRTIRLVARRESTLAKILSAIASIRAHFPDLSVRSDLGLALLARVVPGRIYAAPLEAA